MTDFLPKPGDYYPILLMGLGLSGGALSALQLGLIGPHVGGFIQGFGMAVMLLAWPLSRRSRSMGPLEIGQRIEPPEA